MGRSRDVDDVRGTAGTRDGVVVGGAAFEHSLGAIGWGRVVVHRLLQRAGARRRGGGGACTDDLGDLGGREGTALRLVTVATNESGPVDSITTVHQREVCLCTSPLKQGSGPLEDRRAGVCNRG